MMPCESAQGAARRYPSGGQACKENARREAFARLSRLKTSVKSRI